MSSPDFSPVTVIGGGIAGATSAIALSRHGFPVTLIDEQPVAGGQIFRAPSPYARKIVPPNHEFSGGDTLRQKLAASNVDVRFSTRVWGLSPTLMLDLLGPDGINQLPAATLVVANGATERFLPFQGWTTPRIIGLAGASILMRNGGTLPGQSVVVAGSGPLLFSVAHQVLELGGRVVAIVDAGHRSDWLRLGAMLSLDPARLTQATSWMLRLKKAGIPIHHRAHISEAQETGTGLRLTVTEMDHPERRHVYATEAAACGYGLKPSTLITRTAGVQHRHDPVGGYLEPVTDTAGRTSRPDLYVTGDAAGIRGMAVARLRGLITAHAIAHDRGVISRDTYEALTRVPLRQRRRLEAVSRQMLPLMNAGSAIPAHLQDETIVCRCERVKAATLRSAIQAGAEDLNQLKAWTRCGMGPCQGRMCEDSARGLLAAACGKTPEEAGSFTARMPFFPLPLTAVTGDFTYSDIPLPKAAPL
ncbi:NAD(P)/FAD-dependent oxidoreductase [Gluconobacter albidus]|uniref:FAD/NAD(P)-binding oxidoreductase n=1 Tax=Gluconobacter albidus TaxID=318683 RepID=A0AAW3QU27_9PROT|nr:NAD(P)/FAD-dependent oxidoreductase [Gluconobacter albidus]KXV37155.1 hypothetical protein AD941_11995 [Gluconobacter albidus]GBQ85987.1 putative NAD/FAD-dependent oxidoreductase [Gluconobacter albidus NBRC 3250]GLQ67923.1 FAD/NAD(P)-binding oxidoreductase [Gluconobacter albidus]